MCILRKREKLLLIKRPGRRVPEPDRSANDEQIGNFAICLKFRDGLDLVVPISRNCDESMGSNGGTIWRRLNVCEPGGAGSWEEFIDISYLSIVDDTCYCLQS